MIWGIVQGFAIDWIGMRLGGGGLSGTTHAVLESIEPGPPSPCPQYPGDGLWSRRNTGLGPISHLHRIEGEYNKRGFLGDNVRF